MAGIYGNHPEDRHFSRELHWHLVEPKDDGMAEEAAKDRLKAALHALPNALKANASDFQGRLGYNCWSTVDDIDFKWWPSIGRAIRDGMAEEAGKLLIAAVTEKLTKDTQGE